MGYLQLAAVSGLGSSGLGLHSNPLAPILMALALCAFGAALSLLLRERQSAEEDSEDAPDADPDPDAEA